jgi:DNA mismatch repair protein MutS2
MDAHTLSLLEFGKIREILAGYAASSLGAELARTIEPLSRLAPLKLELDHVSEMVAALDRNIPPPLAGLHDVRLIVRRAAIGTMLSAEQLLDVASCLNCTGAIYRYRSRLDEHHPRLIELLSGIEDLGAVAKGIGGCIDGRGYVLDVASRELSAVRQKLFELEEKVKAEVRRLLRDPELRKILSYPNATVNGDHYVLPVAANHRHKVAGVVHRISGTGETAYIEPASIAHLSSDRIALKAEEDREIKRVLRRLSAEVGRVANPLVYSLDVLAKLDLITAKAKFSRDFNMSRPDVNAENRLWLRSARHPILEHLFRAEAKNLSEPRTVVPMDIRLGIGFNILVITGPNTGGKTVALKTTGLLSLMALCGMHIPAGAGSAVPLFNHILADIGDEQSLEQSLSTFSSHITRLAGIFAQADSRTLILLDELGAGTDPSEGAALGRAILDHIDQLGGLAIVTTHLGDLKTYALGNSRAENGAVEFDVETLRPTYRLHIGQFGMSNAVRIARRLKLPEPLLARAEKYLESNGGNMPELARLQQLREAAEQARGLAMAAQHAAEQERAEFRQKAMALEREARQAVELQAQRRSLVPNMMVRVQRFDQVGKVIRVDPKKETVLVGIGIGQWEVPFSEVFPEGN